MAVLLRLELERALITGYLDVPDLEAEWRVRFGKEFGIEPPDAARGVLQDIHWSVCVFGKPSSLEGAVTRDGFGARSHQG